MSTLTMQGIADLANVQRAVVSMWRARFADTAHPFPEPRQMSPLLFDVEEVASWLRETGRGNNPDAGVESPLYSSALASVYANLDHASALMLLHQLRAEPVSSLDLADVAETLRIHDAEAVLDPATAQAASSDAALCSTVDELAEAAFSGSRVLDRVVEAFAAPDGPWAHEALTRSGTQLVGTVVAELLRLSRRPLVPAAPGGLLVAHAAVDLLGEHERPTLVVRPETAERSSDLAAWRRMVAAGCGVARWGEADTGAGTLHVLQQQHVPDEAGFLALVEDALIELGERDVLVVVGPARLLTDRGGAHARRALLTPSTAYTAPLRYVARLPRGLSRYGGRRRLALWVFGQPSSTWTVVGAHSDVRADRGAAQVIAADVAAALSDAVDVNAHAFHNSAVLESRRFLRMPELVARPSAGAPREGGEHLARIWELASRLPTPGLLDDVDLVASANRPTTVALDQVGELGRDLRGVRIADEHLGAPEPGSVTLLGPEEVRDPRLIGRRAIDRLTLEAIAPRARLTAPGDVVYVAAGGPAAYLDPDGGHVVQAPARIFRCRDAERNDRQLVPAVVAADIAAQAGSDRSAWQLRTVPVDRVPALAATVDRVAARQRRLLEELAILRDLERELVDGLAAGALSATLTTTAPQEDHR